MSIYPEVILILEVCASVDRCAAGSFQVFEYRTHQNSTNDLQVCHDYFARLLLFMK